MSYDVSLIMQTGPEMWATASVCGNMTSNVGAMYRLALPATDERCAGLPGLNGLRAEVAIPLLSAAVEAMEADPDRFKAWSPANGWGSYDGALRYLKGILSSCQCHPWATIEVSA